MSELYDQRIEEDPAQVQVTTRAKIEFISNMQRRAHSLKLIIVSTRAANETAPRVQQVYKEYQREAMPV